jgi:phage tail-like protein
MPDKSYSFHLAITGLGGFSLEYDIPIGITTIGRDADNLIQLDDRTVSRHHARLECVGIECEITDLGSSNGSFVNKVKLTPNTPTPLSDQDQVGIGPSFLMIFSMVEVVEEPAPSETPEAPPPPEIPEVQAEPVETPARAKKKAAPPVEPPPAEPPIDESSDADLPKGVTPPGLSILSHRLLNYLPGIYHTESMARFLGIFEATLLPIEWTIDNFDLYLSPRTTPTGFLPWLANWFDAEFDKTWSEKQQRQFLEDAWLIYGRRGTKWALSRVLEIYTDQIPIIDDLADDLKPHSFRVSLPVNEKNVNRTSVEALINFYKPAHTDYELHFKG